MKLPSETRPILVDFVPREALHLPGKLGLTIAPGRARLDPAGDWDRQLDDDLARLRDIFRVSVLVTLLEKLEMERLGIPDLLRRAARSGLETLWFPIPDFWVPDPRRPSPSSARPAPERCRTRPRRPSSAASPRPGTRLADSRVSRA